MHVPALPSSIYYTCTSVSIFFYMQAAIKAVPSKFFASIKNPQPQNSKYLQAFIKVGTRICYMVQSTANHISFHSQDDPMFYDIILIPIEENREWVLAVSLPNMLQI